MLARSVIFEQHKYLGLPRPSLKCSSHVSQKPPPTFGTIANYCIVFAFWLRSSVVSVLFSLISEMFLREQTLIILIFGPRRRSLCACAWIIGTVSLALHCRLLTRTVIFSSHPFASIAMVWRRGIVFFLICGDCGMLLIR